MKPFESKELVFGWSLALNEDYLNNYSLINDYDEEVH